MKVEWTKFFDENEKGRITLRWGIGFERSISIDELYHAIKERLKDEVMAEHLVRDSDYGVLVDRPTKRESGNV